MYFRYQLKRGFFCIEAAFVLMVAIICYFVAGENNLQFDSDFLSNFMMAQSENVIAIIFPMLVCLPVAMKYTVEYKSGYFNLAAMKMPLANYIRTKLLCNGIVGGTLIAIPAVLYLLRIILAKGISAKTYIESDWEVSLFPNLYETHPLGYAFIIIISIFFCGVVFATLGLGVAAALKKSYLAILFPLIYYIGSAIAFSDFVKSLDATTLYVLNSNPHPNLILNFLYGAVLMGIGIMLFIYGVRKNVK